MFDSIVDAFEGSSKCKVSVTEATHHGYRVRCNLHGTLAFHAFSTEAIVERHLKTGWIPARGKIEARNKRILRDAKHPDASESTKAEAERILAGGTHLFTKRRRR